jgi:hypothetical protein
MEKIRKAIKRYKMLICGKQSEIPDGKHCSDALLLSTPNCTLAINFFSKSAQMLVKS